LKHNQVADWCKAPTFTLDSRLCYLHGRCAVCRRRLPSCQRFWFCLFWLFFNDECHKHRHVVNLATLRAG